MLVLAFLKGCVPVWVRSSLSLSVQVLGLGAIHGKTVNIWYIPSGNQTWHCKMSVNGHLNQKRTDVMCVNEDVSEFPYLRTHTLNGPNFTCWELRKIFSKCQGFQRICPQNLETKQTSSVWVKPRLSIGINSRWLGFRLMYQIFKPYGSSNALSRSIWSMV